MTYAQFTTLFWTSVAVGGVTGLRTRGIFEAGSADGVAAGFGTANTMLAKSRTNIARGCIARM